MSPAPAARQVAVLGRALRQPVVHMVSGGNRRALPSRAEARGSDDLERRVRRTGDRDPRVHRHPPPVARAMDHGSESAPLPACRANRSSATCGPSRRRVHTAATSGSSLSSWAEPARTALDRHSANRRSRRPSRSACQASLEGGSAPVFRRGSHGRGRHLFARAVRHPSPTTLGRHRPLGVLSQPSGRHQVPRLPDEGFRAQRAARRRSGRDPRTAGTRRTPTGGSRRWPSTIRR